MVSLIYVRFPAPDSESDPPLWETASKNGERATGGERESPPSLSGALLRRGVPHSVPNSKRDLGCVNLPPNLRGCRCTALQAARGECADDFSLLSWKSQTPTRATTAAANSHQEEEEAWKEDGPATAALIVLRSVGKTIFRFAVVNSSHFYAGNRDVRFSG